MPSGFDVLKLILEGLKGEAAKHKIKVSRQCFGMYKKEKTLFWRAVIRQDYSYLGDGLCYCVELSVVPTEFDEIRFRITNPGEDIKITDVLRANRGFAFFTISKKKYLYKETDNHSQKEMIGDFCTTILNNVRNDVAEFEKITRIKYVDIFHYLIAKQKDEPILAGLAYIFLQDYQNAMACFELAERDGNYWNLCYGSPNRYFHHVCRDYCSAMLYGIPWNRKYVDGIIEIPTN